MKYAIVICTRNRPKILDETYESIIKLKGEPQIIIVISKKTDSFKESYPNSRVKIIIGPEGSSFQRNAGIAALDLNLIDIVFFFDDDVEVHETYLIKVGELLTLNQDIVAGSGNVLHNGNISRKDAQSIIKNFDPTGKNQFSQGRIWILYGCNMFIRANALKSIRFDENLPSFAWAEDYEISIRLSRIGKVGRFNNAAIVHLKTPSGRLRPHVVSYAMISNNLYFLQKGIIHSSHSLAILRFFYICFFWVPVCAFFKNCKGLSLKDKLLWHKGCFLAWTDILLNRCKPSRILDM